MEAQRGWERDTPSCYRLRGNEDLSRKDECRPYENRGQYTYDSRIQEREGPLGLAHGISTTVIKCLHRAHVSCNATCMSCPRWELSEDRVKDLMRIATNN